MDVTAMAGAGALSPLGKQGVCSAWRRDDF